MRIRIAGPAGIILDMDAFAILRAQEYRGVLSPPGPVVLEPGTRLTIEATIPAAKGGGRLVEVLTVPDANADL